MEENNNSEVLNQEKIRQFVDMIHQSDNIVFFGGAGVSTESGLPDFRSVDGIYNQKYDYPPETILSRTFFMKYPEEFYRFYRDKMIYSDAKPSTTHCVLAQLEKEGKLKAVITQNIDGLHQMAGSKNVIELHGTVHKNHCVACGKFYGLDAVTGCDGIPRCECGGRIKPDVVLYEEGLDNEKLTKAVKYVREADVLIVGGTSLVVYPAAGLIDYYQGHKLVLINKSTTPFDHRADLLINDGLGKVFNALQND
ncbi:MAG: NAD-dependent protein deacylase [Lachnospiraceae bacterium]